MKNEKLKNRTTEKLESTLTAIKIISSALIGVLALLFIISIYGLIVKENKTTFISLITVAISLSAVLPLQFIIMKNINNELNKRKINN
jgi:NADH:ubiquinone oxidoreductase subunit K